MKNFLRGDAEKKFSGSIFGECMNESAYPGIDSMYMVCVNSAVLHQDVQIDLESIPHIVCS